MVWGKELCVKMYIIPWGQQWHSFGGIAHLERVKAVSIHDLWFISTSFHGTLVLILILRGLKKVLKVILFLNPKCAALLTNFICSLAAYINKDGHDMDVKEMFTIMRSKLNNESKLFKKNK